MKKIRLVALDIDGTLVDDQKRLPEANREALQAALRAGVRVAIASGRMTPRIEAIEELLGVDCVIVAYNGAKVVTPRTEGRETLSHCPLPAEVAEFFIDYSHANDHLLNFYHDDQLFAQDGERRRRFMDIYAGRTGAEYQTRPNLDEFRGVSPTKLILLADPPERDRLHDHFREEFGDRAFITKSDPEYLEIMAPGVHKGVGLATLARHYGFTCENILAVGDAENDLGLLESAGIGVAVANADPKVKAVADFVTERTNNEGAVAEAIERWVLTS